MTFAKDSPLAARVVETASNERGPRPGGLADIRAIVIHMAEGGGTVSWLTRADGNSSHYVVEYDGEIVQMVREAHWAGSLNPRALRTTDDAYFEYLGLRQRYGKSEAVRALGGLTYYNDPNRFVIAIEVEGFAATGPNAKQRESLKRLAADIRRRRAKPFPVVCHRDFQSYKACPGRRIPWGDYGGHAVKATAPLPAPTPAPEVPMAIKGSTVPEVPTQLWLKPDAADATKSRWLYVYSDHRVDAGNTQLKPIRPLLLTRFIDADTYAVAYEPAAGDANDTSVEMFVKSVDVARTAPVVAAAPVDTSPFTQAQLDAATLAAKRAGYDLARAGFAITHPAPTVTWPPRP